MRYCSRFICSLTLFYSRHCSTCDFNENILPQAKDKSTMRRHITIVLFSLLVEDHRLWFVDIKLDIFESRSDGGEID